VTRVKENVCTDTVFMQVYGQADGIPGHSGAIGFQLFVGHDTKHLAVFPVKTDGAFPETLEEYICMHGAPQKLFSNNAKAKTSNRTKAILRNFGIADGSSEPYYQNQNAAEREIQDVKNDIEKVMNITNFPDDMWPLCAEYICLVKNHTARAALNDRTPFENHTGQTPDVSKFFQELGMLSTHSISRFLNFPWYTDSRTELHCFLQSS
jgi:hypothetical protein